jgi:hypothetical protein
MSKNITGGRLPRTGFILGVNVMEIDKAKAEHFGTLRRCLSISFLCVFVKCVVDAMAWLEPGKVNMAYLLFMVFIVVPAVQAVDALDPVNKSSGYFTRIFSWIPVAGYLTSIACFGIAGWHYIHFGSW